MMQFGSPLAGLLKVQGGSVPGEAVGAATGLQGLLEGAVEGREADLDAIAPGFDEQLRAMLEAMPEDVLGQLQAAMQAGTPLPEAARDFLLALQGNALEGIAGLDPVLPERPAGSPVAPGAQAGEFLERVRPLADTLAQLRLGATRWLAGQPADSPPQAAGALAGNPLAELATLAHGQAAVRAGGFAPLLTDSLLDMGIPQRPGSANWGQAVGERVLWMVQGDRQFAELKLNPPNLGPLEVRVSVNQDQTSVSFLANHAAVRDALEAALPRLREMFDQQALQLVNVDVGQRDPGAGGEASGTGGQGGSALSGDTGDEPAGEGTAVQDMAASGSGLVDLFA